MKKILYLLVTIFMFALFRGNVYASSFSLTLDGDENFDDEVSFDVIVNNLSGFTEGIYGLEATLSYDKAKIELKEITANSAYTVTYDKTASDSFVVTSGSGLSNGTTLVTITFKNKGLSVGQSAVVTLTGIVGSDGEEDVPIDSTYSKTLTLTDSNFLKGDMNQNGKIDLADVILLLRKYLNNSATATDVQIGDMDNNGSITLSDIIALLRLYLNS